MASGCRVLEQRLFERLLIQTHSYPIGMVNPSKLRQIRAPLTPLSQDQEIPLRLSAAIIWRFTATAHRSKSKAVVSGSTGI